MLGLLRRNLRITSNVVKTQAYEELVRPQLESACTVWDPHTRVNFRRLENAVACALVTSHLDYCNSLLYNLPDRDIERSQRVQNCPARVVCKASCFSGSKPLINFLHWLPVKYRIRFKLCTITFKAFLFHQPTYLFNYLVPLQNSRLLRSSNTKMLTVPRFRTKWGSIKGLLQLQLPPH